MDSTREDMKPNDVAMILRPIIVEGEEWDGGFEVVIAGIGPITMPEDSMRELISMAMLVATTIPMMENDSELTEKIMIECAKVYGDADDVDIQTLTTTEEGLSFTIDSKTVGGVH
jgi:hypothetical protein